MISTLRDVALSLVKADPRWSGHTPGDLENYVLATGYDDAPRPHISTSDLIYVYAANLRNSGGAGVNLLRQGDMFRGALQGSVVDNQVKPPQPEVLAQLCLDYLRESGIRLTKDDAMYRRQLQATAEGQQPTTPLSQHLYSVHDFACLLARRYRGCAEDYAASFEIPVTAGYRRTLLKRLRELYRFNGIGIATGLNFLKDSQVPRFAGSSLADVRHHPVASIIKPDRHVMRLMLLLTGRLARTGIAPDALWNMKETDALEHYQHCEPTAVWCAQDLCGYAADLPKPRSGVWKAIADVHALADAEEVAPLEIDRLLYLIGSGKYVGGSEISTPQAGRYRALCQTAWQGTAP
jgi:hypothetical protein